MGRLLLQGGRQISLLEAFTGGQLAHMFVSDPTAAQTFRGGLVLPGNQPGLLPSGFFQGANTLLDGHGKEVAAQMAAAVRRYFGSGVGIATVGAELPSNTPATSTSWASLWTLKVTVRCRKCCSGAIPPRPPSVLPGPPCSCSGRFCAKKPESYDCLPWGGSVRTPPSSDFCPGASFMPFDPVLAVGESS